MPPSAGSSSPPQVTIPVSGSGGIGNLSIAPPTFLEKWGVVFVSVGGFWMLCVCIAMLWFYLAHLELPPTQTPVTKIEDYKLALDLYQKATEQFRNSLSFMFDLMVTKTILPLLTL